MPGKNIRPLVGRPLIGWTIGAARACDAIDAVLVSTDADDIAKIARAEGVEVAMRPDSLATDTATSADVVRHHLAEWAAAGRDYDALVLLQPTSPLRTAEDISRAVAALFADDLDSLASFTDAATHPQTAWRIEDGTPKPFLPDQSWVRRQDLEPAYTLNGAVYVVRADRFPSEGSSFLFGKTGAYVMPPERSVDIDTLEGFLWCEFILGREAKA